MTKIREDAPYKDFAQRLAQLRTKAGLTRAQLADQAGISPRSIANYESGERIPYGDTCARLAEIFEVSTDELLGVENPEVEMARAKTIDEMGRIFGSDAAASAQTYINGAGALLAGGTLSAEDQLDFIEVMRKVLADAEVRARERYTPAKFRSEEWKETMNEKKQQVDEIMKDADRNLRHENNQ